MVYFSCGNCGSSLKKNQVEKHNFQCRTYGALTCIDCNTDFPGDEYKLHTKCVSEIERYSAKGWQPPANHNKGEKKQQAWLDVVQATLDKNASTLKPATKNLLNILTKHDNVPRKRPKFLNFISNVTRRQFDDRTVAEVWDLLEAQWKLDKPAPAPVPATNGKSNGTVKEEEQVEESEPTKRKKKKESNGTVKEEEPTEESEPVKKKKKKESNGTVNEEEPVISEEPAEENEPVKKKKKKTKAEEEHVKLDAEEPSEKPKKKKKVKAEVEEEQVEGEEPVQDVEKRKKKKQSKIAQEDVEVNAEESDENPKKRRIEVEEPQELESEVAEPIVKRKKKKATE